MTTMQIAKRLGEIHEQMEREGVEGKSFDMLGFFIAELLGEVPPAPEEEGKGATFSLEKS